MRTTELIAEAEEFFLQGNLAQVTQKLNHVLVFEPQNKHAKRALIDIYIEEDKTEAALGLVDELIKDSASETELLFFRASFLADLDRIDESLDLFSAILEDTPDFYEANAGRGMLYCKIGKFEEAIKDLNLAISKDKKSAYLLFKRATIYLEQDDYKKALKDLNKSLRIDKNMDEARICRAVVLRLLGKKEKALKDFDKVVDETLFDSDTYMQKGIVYRKNKNYPQALAYHDLAIEKDPNNASAYKANLKKAHKALDNLTKKVKSELKGDFKSIVFHDAYQYFEKKI